MDKVTRGQIIRTNAVYGGKPRANDSLDYAIEKANEEKNFYRKLAYLVRSMTSNHTFIDGNKRTATTIILSEFAEEGININEKMLTNTIINLAKTGEGDINIIERKLRRCSRK
ncbi:MAG: Fic family protein [Candidatus Pacearchaeota archaeon]|jgi:prophage maintenance system killer protein